MVNSTFLLSPGLRVMRLKCFRKEFGVCAGVADVVAEHGAGGFKCRVFVDIRAFGIQHVGFAFERILEPFAKQFVPVVYGGHAPRTCHIVAGIGKRTYQGNVA